MKKSAIRAPVEHVFAVRKQAIDLTIETVGLARASAKIGLAAIAYDLWGLVQLCKAAA